MKINSAIAMILLLGSINARAQETKTEAKKEIEELRLKLNDDGSHYIKATFLNQVV